MRDQTNYKGDEMKKILGITVLALSMIVSATAFAGGNGNRAKITRVYAAEGSKNVSVWLSSGGITNPDKCSNTNKLIFQLDDNFRHERLLKLIMTAYTTKQDVLIWQNACHTENNGKSFPIGRAINLL